MPEVILTKNAQIIPNAIRRDASLVASVLVIRPLGMGRSGRSTISRSASKTSLKTTPPPYRPMVDRQRSKTGKRFGTAFKLKMRYPEIATPAKISATEVTMFAGLISLRYPVVFFTIVFGGFK
jgi:hypothetical protein